jgi:type II secretory pathway pseudopilin PulG
MHAVPTALQARSALTPALSQGESRRTRRAFSLTELLVVIGIIVLLVGLLLVALSKVKEKSERTRTESIMQGFANACAAFQADNEGKLPGVIPDEVILNNPGGNGGPAISSTANALLHLLGGYRVMGPFDQSGGQVDVDYLAYRTAAAATNSDHEITFGGTGWKIIVDTRKIGEGPVINGKPRAPYLTLKGNETGISAGLLSNTGDNDLPELIDAWGQPIIYVRRVREKGPLLRDSNAGTSSPQYLLGGVAAYIGWPLNSASDVYSTALTIGELQADQIHTGTNTMGSLFTAGTPDQRNRVFAFLLRHPGVSPKASNADELLYGSPRGTMMLFSAGPDGVFYSAVNGAGSTSAPVTDLTTAQYLNNARVWDEYDDIVVFAGG